MISKHWVEDRQRRMGESMHLENTLGCAARIVARMDIRLLDFRTLGSPSDLFQRAKRLEVVFREDLAELALLSERSVPLFPSAESNQVADLYEFAQENAVAGCIDEYFQFKSELAFLDSGSEAAGKLLLRMHEHMVSHVDACWDIHYWCLSQLSPQRGRNIRAAQRDALRRWREAGARLDSSGINPLTVEQRIDAPTAAA